FHYFYLPLPLLHSFPTRRSSDLTHHERKNAYYQYRDSEKICQLILKSFGPNPEFSRIINGHTPVKTTKGESPVRGGGHLFVIDGDRKSTRLNSSHVSISYAVFCL